MTLNDLYMVDLITNEISENLGRLFKFGVLDAQKSVELVKVISDAQVNWMQIHYRAEEIEAFMATKKA